MKKKNRLLGVALVVGALLTAFPFFWMATSSLKPLTESVTASPSILPHQPTFSNYMSLFRNQDFGTYLVNTIVVVAIDSVGVLLMAMAGYAFAKLAFRGKRVMFSLILGTLMIPIQVTMIPTYLELNSVRLTNTLLGIALPTLVSAFGIFLFRQFMSTIPEDLLEAARLDGASDARTFFSVILPMSRPVLAVQAVLTFIASWNSFLWPLVIANDQSKYTLSVGLALLNQQQFVNPGLQMAGAALMVLPILILFVILQKQIVRGFVTSGLK